MQERWKRNEREISPLDVMRKYREKGEVKKTLPDTQNEGFLNISGLNMILQDLKEEEREALSVAFTKVVFAFMDTGRIPAILPITKQKGIDAITINQN